ncbi:acyl carrier protein [Agarivorans sp. MS3-6]|uniref:acyl carrier protein n=1 Tax=Agarivorans sp. TSD2052 TaxID=2937286 RepID=UPI00200F6E8F|nr:acyl carrier protein [Agarivorans sp. TSD2052]UPW20166.1 acyl carrier protein [Agarivorans sp. TSD2052]
MNLEQRIRECFESAAQLCGCTLIENIENQTVLLESGLDSLGFALLVAQLEEELGLDPFSEMEMAVYPRTFGEFLSIYQRSADK